MTYAARTTVPVERSRAEIEKTLGRYGATAFMVGWDEQRAVIAFAMAGRQIRFALPLPDPAEYSHLAPSVKTTRIAQDTRQKWRALALVIKAKLEAVEAGITTVEDEFLANTVLPSGLTLSEWVQPQLVRAYASGEMPPMLPKGQLRS